MKTSLVATILALGIAAPALAAEDTIELRPYGEFDADASTKLNDDELRTGLFTSMDANEDGSLQEAEYSAGDGLFGGNLATADANADQAIDQDEYRQAYDKSELLGQLDTDADSEISEDEFNTWRQAQ